MSTDFLTAAKQSVNENAAPVLFTPGLFFSFPGLHALRQIISQKPVAIPPKVG